MTYEEYHRKGYAILTCAHLIIACEENGLQTYWNCSKENLASIVLANILGYLYGVEYKLAAWFKEKGP